MRVAKRRLDFWLPIPALPGQAADYGRATLGWLLTPVGMVAMPAGWPGVATAVDRSPVNLGCSDSCGMEARLVTAFGICRWPLLRVGIYGALGRSPGEEC